MNEKRDAENHCIICDKGHLANVTISWRAIRYSSSKIHDILFHRKYHFQIPETYLAKFVVPCKDIKPMKPKIKPRHTHSIFSQHSKVASCFCLGAINTDVTADHSERFTLTFVFGQESKYVCCENIP